MPRTKLKGMFEEYNHKYYDELLESDKKFAYLADKYHELDVEIHELDKHDHGDMHNQREQLKRKRIGVKDEAYAILTEYKNNSTKV
jgi:uncharacterized protein YdcH (DUF465 family)